MSTKTTSLKDLQRQCKAAGLDAKGTKADLAKRLQVKMAQEAPPPESQDDPDCEAILATRTEVGDDEGMESAAKDALGGALEAKALSVEDVGGKPFVGNRRSPEFAGLAERTRVLEEQAQISQERIVTLEIDVGSLGERVSSLTTSLDTYKFLRNRFISTFKRYKLGNATAADKRLIAEGNASAHGGDAVVDAMLYQTQTTNSRRDPSAYKRLYGFNPLVVLGISPFHLWLYLLGRG